MCTFKFALEIRTQKSYNHFSSLLKYEVSVRIPSPRRSRGLVPSPEDAERHSDEMARDEARHGKAFQGLLKRYFGE